MGPSASTGSPARPGTDRSARHYLRTRLSWAGLGTPTPGVWVGTHTDRLGAVEDVLRQAGVFDDAQMFVAEHQGHTAIRAMVAEAWDLEEIGTEYRRFISEFKERARPALDPLAGTVALVHGWRRFPWVDPALPADLLPARWPGSQAAELFGRRHAALAPAAKAEWERIAAG
jgi:phenylacetic acid degradation operon negative regulatory protein